MTEPLLNGLSWLLLIGGLLFFVAGSIGLLRFPDTVSRLHALTKADTLGLGLVIAGVCCCWPPAPRRANCWRGRLARSHAMTEWLFDGVLGLLVLGLAFGALHGRNLYASVLLFIAFGLALALIWARLGAADLALAEAAIGAGLTGVLLFTALSRQPGPADLPEATGTRLRLGAAAVVLPMLILLVQGLAPLSEVEPRLPALITRHLDETGVSHPVTAVLLNYRAWDTLLELAVLLLALLGARQLGPRPLAFAEPWPLLRAWARVLAPLLVLAAGYILWRGASAPGGAFQAGALLASGVVLLRLSGLLPRLRWSFMPLRLLVLGGLLVFVGVAVATAWLGEGWLTYPGGAAKPIILMIETVATLSIAASLSLLVVGEGEEVSS